MDTRGIYFVGGLLKNLASPASLRSHNLLVGVGVELLDLPHVVEKLQVFVSR